MARERGGLSEWNSSMWAFGGGHGLLRHGEDLLRGNKSDMKTQPGMGESLWPLKSLIHVFSCGIEIVEYLALSSRAETEPLI